MDALTLVISACGVLASCVAVLFKRSVKQADDLAHIKEKYGEQKGENRGIRRLSEEVLQTVEDALKDPDRGK